jgi:hypothetical protein
LRSYHNLLSQASSWEDLSPATPSTDGAEVSLALESTWTRAAGATTTPSSTTTAHTTIRILNAPILGIVRSGTNLLIDSRINSNRNPSKDPIGKAVAQQNILHKWINVLRLASENTVFGVGGELLRVVAVGAEELDLRYEVLVEEELADVRRVRVVGVGDCAVLELGQAVGVVG